MGIKFFCPNGHKLNVKSFQAGRKGICPYCGAKVEIPLQSTRSSGAKKGEAAGSASAREEHPEETELFEPQQTPPRPIAQPTFPTPAQPAFAAPAKPAFAAPVQPSYAASPQAAAMPAYVPPEEPATPTQPWSFTSPGAGAGMAAPAGTSAASVFASEAPPPAAPAAPLEDPLAAAPDAVWYVRPNSGGQFGPATSQVMRSWLSEGRVSGDTLVWREGWAEWKEAAAVFAELRADAAPPPAGPAAPPMGPAVATAQPAAAPATVARAQGGMNARQTQRLVIVGLVVLVVLLTVVFFVVVLWPGSSSKPSADPGGGAAPAQAGPETGKAPEASKSPTPEAGKSPEAGKGKSSAIRTVPSTESAVYDHPTTVV